MKWILTRLLQYALNLYGRTLATSRRMDAALVQGGCDPAQRCISLCLNGFDDRQDVVCPLRCLFCACFCARSVALSGDCDGQKLRRRSRGRVLDLIFMM
jgi:hypothetical protein